MGLLPTYPNGYSGGRATIPIIRTRWDVQMLDPEFKRRVFRMMRHARLSGIDLGIGGAGRSAAQQEALFRSRYVVDPAGNVVWNGQRWSLKPGMAPAAPPGRSYHEETTPDRKALAADMVGNLGWMNANCHSFGLRHFAQVNGEPWHVQPTSVPNSRAAYTPAYHPLHRWVFPPLP